MSASANSGWWIGLVVGFAIVVIVVAVVAAVLTFASRVVDRAGDAVEALAAARESAGPLQGLERTHEATTAILTGAQAARRVLPGGR